MACKTNERATMKKENEKEAKRNRFLIHRRLTGLKLCVCCTVMCIAVFLAACGAGTSHTDNASHGSNPVSAAQDPGQDTDLEQEREWVYVPERIIVEDEKADYGDMQLVGDTACYVSRNGEAGDGVQSICQYSLTDKKLTSAPIAWGDPGEYREVGSYLFGQDGDVWMVANVYSEGYSRMNRFLCKFDREGKNLLSQDITEQLGKGTSITGLAQDDQGRIYIFTGEEGIWLYGSDGSFHGSVPYEFSGSAQFKGTVIGEDGKFYACLGKEESPDHCALMEVDFEGCKLIAFIEDFPNINGFCAGKQTTGEAAGQYDLLLYDNVAVYGYDFSAQKPEELFSWLDSDINGYFVTSLCPLEDGRYYATVEDWENDDRSIVVLNRTSAKEAPQRDRLVLAAVNPGSDLAAMAVNFNRGNDQYHLTVKNYGSLTDLYNAILAKETMDIIDLSGVDVERLSQQGVFEDLAPYVDKSSAFQRTDFLDGILEVYTFDGILVGIPETFTLRTVVGDGAQFGDGAGLSLEGLLAAAGKNPAALPFDGVTKEEMMQYLMMFNEDAFIDWDTGECHFDTETFKEILEFVNRLPDGLEGGREEVSLPNKIQNGQVLFAIAELEGLKSFQPYRAMFGENAACIGFPTADGQGGTLLFPSNAFGIVASSGNKEGAWEFIEGILVREKAEYHEAFCRYFPTMKKALEELVNAEMEKDSQRPTDKFPAEVYEDGWMFTYYAVTWDEINRMLDLLKEAKPFFDVENTEILRIIQEEAAGYYSGQKGIEEVVSVIQNRIQLYVNENR